MLLLLLFVFATFETKMKQNETFETKSSKCPK